MSTFALKSISKVGKYNWPLLFECLWYLRKWDAVIQKQPYESWKKHLDSKVIMPSFQHSRTSLCLLNRDYLQKISSHVNVIVRHYPSELNCMRRSLAIKSMIERRHGQCKMHIGVKMETPLKVDDHSSTLPVVAAHAWITVNQVLINDTQEKVSQYHEITNDNIMFASSTQLT